MLSHGIKARVYAWLDTHYTLIPADAWVIRVLFYEHYYLISLDVRKHILTQTVALILPSTLDRYHLWRAAISAVELLHPRAIRFKTLQALLERQRTPYHYAMIRVDSGEEDDDDVVFLS